MVNDLKLEYDFNDLNEINLQKKNKKRYNLEEWLN